MILIDYEYGMWNPQYYDIGNYLNELTCDNAYPKGSGVRYYLENWPTDEEIESITREYFMLTKPEGHWSMDNEECRSAVKQVKQCMILNNYYWGVWAVMMLSEADETDPNVFNWDFLEGRCDLHLKCVEQFQMGQI